MKRILALLIAVVLLGACGEADVGDAVLSVPEEEPEPVITTTPPITTTAPPEPEIEEEPRIIEPLPTHLAELNWVVEPIYEYDNVNYCLNCDVFLSWDGILDEATGLSTQYMHGAHGGGRLPWIYDPQLDLMGKPGSNYGSIPIELHPATDFALHFPNYSDSIKVVYSADTTAREEHSGDEWLSRETFSKAAVAVGNDFITDFIYNDWGGSWFWVRAGREVADMVEVFDENGKHGIIDRNGNAVIPFEFDDILLIGEWTAFVKFNGYWGIVAFTNYVPEFKLSGTFATYIDGEWVSRDASLDY